MHSAREGPAIRTVGEISLFLLSAELGKDSAYVRCDRVGLRQKTAICLAVWYIGVIVGVIEVVDDQNYMSAESGLINSLIAIVHIIREGVI